MKNIISGVALAALMAVSGHAAAAKIQIKDGPTLDVFGFAQVVARQVDRQGANSHRDDLEFTEDRVRFGTKMKWGQWSGAFQFDANENDTDAEGTLDSFIRDAFGAYKFNDAFRVKAGQFKTPVGMAYNMSGSKLPLLRRTMTSQLVLNRTLGVMLSGRHIGGSREAGGFGYDIGVFNPAGRSRVYANTDQNDTGDNLSYAARMMYDYGKVFHIEASYGQIEDAGGLTLFRVPPPVRVIGIEDGTGNPVPVVLLRPAEEMGIVESEDYEVYDIGALYQKGPVRLRAEYIDAEDILGVEGVDEQAWFLEAGYRFTDVVEGVVRYQQAECDNCGTDEAPDRELDRFEVGLNLFLGQNDKNGRIQLYYADVGEDEEGYSGVAGGGNNRFDMIGAQLQFAF